jgi:serine/threonine protein kinase
LSRKEYNGEEADMWAYGIIMFALGEGRLPFRAENIKELERVVKRGKF